MKLIISAWHNPEQNLALETQLLTERLDDVLLLYRNMPVVVVGRNQSLEAEVDVAFCAEAGIPVLRRVSGGGTVYHDLGNINYALITQRGTESVLDLDSTGPMVAALHSLGIEAVVGARKELLVDGYKVSGTASHATRTRHLFHGTLLHRTDLSMLERVLRGDSSKRGKRVASVPGRVANIAELIGSDESTADFMQRLAEALRSYYGTLE